MTYEDYLDEEDEELEEDDELEEDEDYEESEQKISNVFGLIVMFGFISIIVLFFCAMMITVHNDKIMITMYNISQDMISEGKIPAVFSDVFYETADSYRRILDVLDWFWASAFVLFASGSLVFAYRCKRENLFSTFSYIVFGIILMVYLGGIILQITNWLKDLVNAMFPSILINMPKFNFYLEHAGLINAILFILVIILNQADLDLSRFDTKKDDEVKEL